MTNSQDSTVTVPLTQAEQVRSRIVELQEALQKNMPGYEGLLHTIHRNLAQDPDTVHLLSEDEIGIICLGLAKRTGVFIAQEKEGKSGSKKSKATLDDLI